MASGLNQHIDEIGLLFVGTMESMSRKNMTRRARPR